MGGTKYDAGWISRYYDAYGEREWERFAASPADRVSLHLHRRYLRRYVRPGDRVLEAGAGPGRFTIELARIGAAITVGDISPGQLAINAEKVAAAGCEGRVVERAPLDIIDLARFPDGSFDAAVCYGGPLSYVFDRADEALAGLLRVTRPGGHVLLSVMSLAGGTARFLEGVLAIARQRGPAAVQGVIDTGDLHGEAASNGHHCHMFRWSELAALFTRHPCRVVAASAANFLSIRPDEALREIADDPALWAAFLGWEEDFCREPGALDGGTHIIAVLRRA